MITTKEINQKVQLAQSQHKTKQFEEANRTYIELLSVVTHPDIMHLYANFLLDLKQPNKAISVLIDAIRLNPSSAPYHNTLGMAYRNNNNDNEALKHFNRAIAIAPNFAPAYLNLGQLFRVKKKWTEALALFKEGLSHDSKNPNIYLDIGNLLRDIQSWDESISYFNKALSLNSSFTKARYNLALTLRDKGDYSQALALINQLITTDPANPKAALLRGELLEHSGELKTAMEDYRNCLKIDRTFTEAYWSIANISEVDFSDKDRKDMIELVDQQLTPRKKVFLYFSLAKAFEEKNEYQKSFAYLEKGNMIKNSSIVYDKRKHTNELQLIKTIFSEKYMNSLVGLTNSHIRPIFILGVPRSGTSLIEQILTSYSDISVGGEITTMAEIVFERLPKKKQTNWVDSLRGLDKQILEELAAIYIDKNNSVVESAYCFTDKLPFNYTIIGLIYAMFPNAKFIHVYKNPIDGCFSCYKQLFTAGQEFSYCLDNLADYYLSYQNIMQHWNAIIPRDAIYNVSYEKLIENPEKQMRAILGFIDIPFDKKCLDFHKLGRTVSTASSGQVRRPLFNTSVLRWEKYRPFLKKLTTKLTEEQSF
ncbi:MAG: sulfotransferase [Kangiellaceae bacterium]